MESESQGGRQGASESQRPTIERIVANDLVELEPSFMPGGEELLVEAIVSLEQLAGLPLEFGVRYTVELLRALAPLHTDMAAAPSDRVYGRVAVANSRVNADGAVFWLPRSLATLPPDAWQAPEVRVGQAPDQQSDVFAMGMLLLELIRAAVTNGGADSDALSGRLLQVARKATAPVAESRWQSALEFADELVRVAGPRLPTAAAFGMLLRDRMLGAALVLPAPPISQALTRLPGLDSLQPEVISQRQGIELRSFSPATSGHPPERLTAHGGRRSRGWRLTLAALVTIASSIGVWSALQKPQAETATLMSADVALPLPEPTLEPTPEQRPAASPVQESPEQLAAATPAQSNTPPQASAAAASVPAPRPAGRAVSSPKREKSAPKASPRKAAVYDPEGI